jgi:3-oxoadipate enol-lactonase
VVCGTQDSGTTPALAAELAGAIANARLVALPAAHLSNIEAEDAFNAALRAQLSGVS